MRLAIFHHLDGIKKCGHRHTLSAQAENALLDGIEYVGFQVGVTISMQIHSWIGEL